MDTDDRQIGRILRRREVLALLGAAGGTALLGRRLATGSLFTPAATALAQTMPACVVKPELTEGPYFVDDQLERSDIRSEPSDGTLSQGVPLAIAFNVSQVGGGSCAPLAGARVDVWHCDALGVYSDVNDTKKFLRGYQLTDTDGAARFVSIYPGWYPGRAVHLHFKIRTTATTGAAYEFTSQLFFDEAANDSVFAQQPYASKGGRRMLNTADGIYQAGGDQLLVTPLASDDGYTVTFPIGLDLSDLAVGAADRMGGGGPGFGPPGGPGGRPPGTRR